MLQRLLIKNYAIIEQLDIRFSGQLNIITGETGAGKSILLGALSLILGERADLSVLSDKEKKCVIEGIFEMPEQEIVRSFFLENGLDTEQHIIIRREISATGKSRAFINDTPVTLQQLSALSRMLVDMHQQFDTMQLSRQDFQTEVLDALAGHAPLLQSYKEKFHQWQIHEKRLTEMQQQSLQAGKELDYHRFLFEELEEANFSGNELEELDTELNILSHAEEVKTTLGGVNTLLGEGELTLLQQLKQAQSALQQIRDFHPKLPELVERLRSSAIELEDIAEEIQRLEDDVQLDAARIDFINERLALGYRLLKKHGVQTTSELLAIREELQQKLNEVLDLDEAIAQAVVQRDEALKEAVAIARHLTDGRNGQIPSFEKKVNGLLKMVGMMNASLKVQMQTGPLSPEGQDQVEFLFDANRTGNFQPLRKVASGGELSRLMLCIKSLMARSMALSTLIFDEIDTGISGEAAKQAGTILKGLSGSHQVICITHQPQIAGKADAHYYVVKEARNGKVYTNIRLLGLEERIEVIARMLSGKKPSQAALDNAREMVES